MATAAFKKEDLINLVDEGGCEGLVRVESRILSIARWSINHRMVFKDKASGRFYEAHYSRGATESQDESPFEHDDDLVECEEVHPVEKVVIVYERTPGAEQVSAPRVPLHLFKEYAGGDVYAARDLAHAKDLWKTDTEQDPEEGTDWGLLPDDMKIKVDVDDDGAPAEKTAAEWAAEVAEPGCCFGDNY